MQCGFSVCIMFVVLSMDICFIGLMDILFWLLRFKLPNASCCWEQCKFRGVSLEQVAAYELGISELCCIKLGCEYFLVSVCYA